MKNATQLKAIVRNISKEKKISAQLVLQNHMLERLLERIALSQYKDNFILKGGFLIASMVGLDTRATMDMDVTIKGEPVNPENIRLMFDEIIKISTDEAVKFGVRAGKDSGLFLGISSGAAIAAAYEVAKKLGKGKKVLTIASDSGEKYLSINLFK